MFRTIMLAVAFAAFGSVAHAQDRDADNYEVRARSNGETLQLVFRTNEISEERCRLVVDDVQVREGPVDEESGAVRRGTVHITTSLGDCIEEDGPDTGRTSLDLSQDLSPGRYLLVIDDSLEGRLWVNDDGRIRFRDADREDQL